MIEMLGVFVGGLLGSAHCVGMCGGFVILIGGSQRPSYSAVARQLVYASGRLFTYTFLGAMAGYAGMRLASLPDTLVDFQRTLSIVSGLILMAIGLLTLGVVRVPTPSFPRIEAAIVPLFRHFLGARDGKVMFLAGLANGFLPCGLVYAFISMAMAAANPLRGATLMLIFGLGTVPALTLLGCGSGFFAHRTRARVRRAAAVVVLFSGAITVYRAIPSKRNCCGTVAQPLASSQMAATPPRAARRVQDHSPVRVIPDVDVGRPDGNDGVLPSSGTPATRVSRSGGADHRASSVRAG